MCHIPSRLFLRDNVRSVSGPFNDELGTNASRLPSNFSSCKYITKLNIIYYIILVKMSFIINTLPLNSHSLSVCLPLMKIFGFH